MTRQYKVLWIEDDAHMDLSGLASPVHIAPQYKLVTVLQVSEAVERILETEFDVIITDMRFKADKNPSWWDLAQARQNGNGKPGQNANFGDRLGLQLLYTLLGPDDERMIKIEVPPWITSDRFVVFTVEERITIQDHLSKLKINHYERKQPGLPRRTLKNLIDKVLKERGLVG
ncbi:MAG: hypothetical protein U0670_03375 [Anaerolineae bacterium]